MAAMPFVAEKYHPLVKIFHVNGSL